VLLLLTEGCARVKPVTRGSRSLDATRHAKACRGATSEGDAATRTYRGPRSERKTSGGGVANKAAPPRKEGARRLPPPDLKTLEEQLRETKAIGFFTKITLKN
jgi:hypothetical protein